MSCRPNVRWALCDGLFTGFWFDENAGRIWNSLFDTPAPVGVVKIVLAPVKSGANRAPYGNGQNIHFTRRTGPGSYL